MDPAAEAVRIRAVVDQFFSAAQRHDWDAAAEVMSADFELYTDGAAAFDKQDYVKVLKEDDLVVTSVELRDVEIRVAGDGEMAWGKYRGVFKSRSHDQPTTLETAETLIFKREGGRWKIARAHVSLKAPAP